MSRELAEIGECLKNKDVLRRVKLETSSEDAMKDETSRIEKLAKGFKNDR